MKWIEDLPDDFTHCFEAPDLLNREGYEDL